MRSSITQSLTLTATLTSPTPAPSPTPSFSPSPLPQVRSLEHHGRWALYVAWMRGCVRRWRGSSSSAIVGGVVGRAAATRRAWMVWLAHVTTELRRGQSLLVAAGRHAWLRLERGAIAFAINALDRVRSSTLMLLGHETSRRKVGRAWAARAPRPSPWPSP